MNYLVTIGLETHVQLKTRTKMFCGCSTAFGAEPNTQVCPVCLGYPGALPVMNEEAIRLTVLTGLMLGCRIREDSLFDRKSYFYPDMPKNYQISQYEKPLCEGGSVAFDFDGGEHVCRLERIHLEEDVAKSIHYRGFSGVDFNRAGTPLMEIVTKPDLHAPEEAFEYLLALRRILLYTGVSDANLEEGNVRCDVNCSVRPEGTDTLGTKTEIKNLNTFKGVLNALKFEVARQIEVLESGGTIRQETRRWDMESGQTYPMRTKESEHDYRYFPDPDLVPVRLTKERIAAWKASLPEPPRERRQRLVRDYGIPPYDAGVIAADREVADFFEAAAKASSHPKAISNWVMTDLLRILAETETRISELPLTPAALAKLVALVDDKTINTPSAREVFEILVEKGGDPSDIVEQLGLVQVSDTGELVRLVEQAMAEHPKSVADYRAGKKAAAKFLVGQVMRMSQGKANPQMVNRILAEKLDAS